MSQATADPLNVAIAHHRSGNLVLAEQLYRKILAETPQHADAWHQLGALCLQSGRAGEAVEAIGRAIAIGPDKFEYYNHLGAAYGTLGQYDQAVTSLRRAVQIDPQAAVAHYNLGTALRNQGRLEDAVVSFRHLIAVDPNSAEAHYNLGNTLRELKRLDEAEASLRAAVRARPTYVKAIVNLANVLREQERLAEAIEMLRSAVAIDPQYAVGHLNLGTMLRDAGDYAEAVECLRRAVALEPKRAEAHNNLGTALEAQARFAEALACYEESLRCDPELPGAHFCRATHRLRQGDIEGGFAEFEWRWRCKTYSTRQFAQPRWDGSSLEGRTILLHAEQGLGDTLQFIRYTADVKSRGPTVVIECQPALLDVLKPCAGIDRLVAAGAPLPAVDVQCPLLSLPGVLGLSIDQLARGSYLSADAQRVAQWRETLAPHRGFRVGICWQGNRQHLFDHQRSFPLSRLAPLARVAGVRLISLQKGPGAEQVAEVDFEVIDLGPQWDEAGPFLDTAAIIKNLDLVITCDTATAHLAGGLGAPVWVALSAHGDWRWGADRDDSPWYPTMRLFRQQRLDVWDDVFQRMAQALPSLIAGEARVATAGT